MKNPLIKKKIIVGYFGRESVLAKFFIKAYSKKFIFKKFSKDIRNLKEIDFWLEKNNEIEILINFAAITSVKKCEMNKKKSMEVNCNSVIDILNLINKSKKNNIKYFLSLSTSHVFEKSNLKLKENSKKKPNNYYGKTKLKLENFILKNQNKFKFRIGIGRIFNYYNYGLKKGFFINDVINKLRKNKKTITFHNTDTYRDFISINDINKALLKMINLKLKNDFNICSSEKIYLPDIINRLNIKFKRKLIFSSNKINLNLIGSNLKLKSKGWKITKKNILNELPK